MRNLLRSTRISGIADPEKHVPLQPHVVVLSYHCRERCHQHSRARWCDQKLISRKPEELLLEALTQVTGVENIARTQHGMRGAYDLVRT
jgi:hypothetical protein